MTADLTWSAEDIIRTIHGQCLQEQNWSASGISIDSRSVRPGDLFIALHGPKFDGHDYVADAFAGGAVAAVVARYPSRTPPSAPLVLVEDSFLALRALGREGRRRTHARIVAVTGSVGKTGTKEMLRLMLNEVGATAASEGGLNNHWGLPLSLARLPQAALYGVFEMGMNHAGELAALSEIARPDVGLITTVEAAHLAHFTSIEAIADAKAEIFVGMTAAGTAVLNRDNPHFSRLAAAAKAQGIKRILGFGSEKAAEARLIDCLSEPSGSVITADILGKKIKYRLGALGRHLAFNSVGALAAVAAVGADLAACSDVLTHFRAPKGRGAIRSIMRGDGAYTLVDESYNASPVAVRAAISVLAEMRPPGRRILVLGDMRELGASSADLHRALARDIMAASISAVFCCGYEMKNLFDALPTTLQAGYTETSAELAPLVAEAVEPGDVVTVKGSLSMGMQVIIDRLATPREDSSAKLAS